MCKYILVSRSNIHCFSHTSGAPTLKGAFEKAGLAMMAYMTDLEKVEINESMEPKEGGVAAEDEQSLLYSFMEELLVLFSTE